MIGGKSQNQSMGRRIQAGNKPKATRKKSVSFGNGRYMFYALILIAGAVGIGMFVSGASTIQDIRITGNYFTETEQIILASGISVESHSDSLNYLQIIEKVEALPYVKQAFIEFSPSGRVQLSVRERQPIFLLMDNGDRYYVDKDGVRLPRIRGKVADVPIYYDLGYDTGNDVLSSKAFHDTRNFLLAARTNDLVYITLSEMAWTLDEGVTVLSHENTVRLVFGHEDFDSAIDKWAFFYTNVVPEKGMGSFRRIDFRFRGQVVTMES